MIILFGLFCREEKLRGRFIAAGKHNIKAKIESFGGETDLMSFEGIDGYAEIKTRGEVKNNLTHKEL